MSAYNTRNDLIAGIKIETVISFETGNKSCIVKKYNYSQNKVNYLIAYGT